MSGFTIHDRDSPARDELIELYTAVGWSAYTRDPDALVRAIRGSLRVATARSAGELIGLARIVGDGVTIAYLQDVLVHPSHRRAGIGRRLVEAVLRDQGRVRQQVLLTDDEPGQHAFYRSLGFTESRDLEPSPVHAFVRFG